MYTFIIVLYLLTDLYRAIDLVQAKEVLAKPEAVWKRTDRTG